MVDPLPIVLGWCETLALPDLSIPAIEAKIDTGARSSSLHVDSQQGFTRDGRDWVRFALHLDGAAARLKQKTTAAPERLRRGPRGRRRALHSSGGVLMARAFSFFRAGGFDQVRFQTGADFVALDQLDWKLWVALACPTKGLAFDARTLELLDTDKDNRIRANELVAAVKWAASLIKNPDDFLKAPEELPLAAINDASDEGKLVLASAKTVL